ncbi:uncharacterized protein CLUP02_12823 [Colletotrichum lupini]|uniref:Uncharacterized protein n=1 Tax=Colletotrichum lupini TaxID=145971 RepID=A0A9Q8T153_9PEZI|nr:uncharacterized protein CLUP02_12823 [Colletotrichum lupini]UQC87319.1 hypothetical protein CLUP02_12823 [Colletotrichum lupini]
MRRTSRTSALRQAPPHLAVPVHQGSTGLSVSIGPSAASSKLRRLPVACPTGAASVIFPVGAKHFGLITFNNLTRKDSVPSRKPCNVFLQRLHGQGPHCCKTPTTPNHAIPFDPIDSPSAGRRGMLVN